MVADRLFLIDATFLLEDAEGAFLGSATIVDPQGRDNSVVYGALRGMLRLRGILGIRKGIVVVGAEARGVSSEPNVRSFRGCLEALGTHVLQEPGVRVGALCRSILEERRGYWIVSRDTSLMQLVGSRCGVILTPDGADQDVITVEVLAGRFGISPEQVPSFLALTKGGLAEPLTTKQTARVLESGRNLDAILENRGSEPLSWRVERFLSTNERALLERLQELAISRGQPRTVPALPLVRDDGDSRRALGALGFHSLGRLLNVPARVELVATGADRCRSYVAIVDQSGLRELEEVVASADVCAVDTEATDKDPRKAALVGVAFAVREGQAYYVPVSEAQLHGISVASVLNLLVRLLSRSVKVVGHNLKYDYVLLRRHGVRIACPYFDTMLAAHERFGDWDLFNLSAVAKRLMGKDVTRYRELVGEGQSLLDVPFRDLVEHGCADAEATIGLYDRLRAILREKSIEDQFANETMPLMRLLGDRECDGVRLDIRAVTGKRDALAGEAEVLKCRIYAQAG